MAVAEPALMAAEDLDSTMIRRLEEIKEAVAKKPPLPPWLIPLMMWSVLQLVGSIWWAATMQAKQDVCLGRIDKADGKIEVLEMRANNNDATFGERVRAKVRETIDDLDLIRVRRKDEQ
jgi:hypothetical protein